MIAMDFDVDVVLAPSVGACTQWKDRFQRIANEWRNQWGIHPEVAVSCVLVRDAPRAEVQHAWAKVSGGIEVAVFPSANWALILKQAIFGGDSCDSPVPSSESGTVSDAIVAAAQGAIQASLVAEIGMDPVTDKVAAISVDLPSMTRAGKGAIRTGLRIGSETLWVVASRIGGAATSRKRRKSAQSACASVHEAVQGESVRLQVEIGRVELSIGALSTLRIGDVVRLNTAEEQPVQVMLCAGRKPQFRGHLCSSNGSKAIEVIRYPTK